MQLQDVLTALRNADAAGDVQAAKRLAQIAASMQGAASPYDQEILDVESRLAEIRSRKPPPETSTLGGIGEFFKGLAPGAIGLAESAALGASALLSDETEEAARAKIKELAGVARKPFEAAPGYEESTLRKFGEAAGSTIPFFALGPLGVAGRVGAAGLGSAAGAGEARERAFEAGATAGERAGATGLGTLVGATEILPVFKFIDNLGKPLTDGIVSRLRRVAATGGAEGLQEASAQIAQNLIEKGIYNPEAGVFTGSGEALGYGAGVGGLIQALTDVALGRRQKKVARAEEERQAVAAEEARRAPVGPTEAAPQGELFPVELQEAQAAAADVQGAAEPQVAPEEATPTPPTRDERQLDLIDLLEEQQIAELERVQKMEPIVAEQNEAEIKRIQERNAAELEQARLKFESDLAELDGRIQAKEQKTEEEKRLSLLLPIAEAAVPGNIPKLFVKALKAEGIRDAKLTDRERALIDRIYSFREATPVERTPTPTSPETAELEALIPERKPAREPEQLGIPGIGKREAPTVEEPAAPEAEFPKILSSEVLDRTGLPRQSGFYRQLLNKDMADPEQQPLIADILQRVRANPNVTSATKEAIETVAGQAFGALGVQQEMFGPRGGVLAPEGGKGVRAKKPEPAGVGVGAESDVGGRRGRRVEPSVSGAEAVATPAEPRLDGGRKPAESDRAAKGKQPTALTFPERALMKEFEDAMGKETPKKTKGAAKEAKPSTAGRATERATKVAAEERPTAKPKAAPAEKAKAPTAAKATEDVKQELTPAQKQATDNYLGVTDGNFDKALEYLAGDIYNGSADFYSVKKGTYTKIGFGKVGELVPNTGGTYGKNFFSALSGADQKKVMDMVMEMVATEQRGQAIIKMNDLAWDIEQQFAEDNELEMAYSGMLIGPLHPAATDALKAGDLKKALQILGEKMAGPMAKAAEKLGATIGKTKVETVANLKNESGKPVPGLYDPKTDTIKLDAKSGLVPHVVLHEATHATTSHVLSNKSHPVTKQLTELYNDTKDLLDTAYGAESLDEFVAEAFSNPQFQGKLNMLHPNGDKFSVWQRFSNAITNFVRRMMGLDTKPLETARDRADRLIGGILSPSPESRNAGALYAMSTAPGVRKVMDNLGDIQKTIYKKAPSLEKFGFELEAFMAGKAPETTKRLMLQFLPADVLIDIGNQIPSLKVEGAEDLIRLFKEQRAKLGIENDKVNATYEYLAKWAKANPEKVNTLNRVWPKATLGVEVTDGKRVGVDPDRPRSDYKDNKDQQALWDEMQADWKALGPEGQNAYRQVRDSYAALYERIINVISGTVDVYVEDKQVQKEFRNEVLTKLTEMAGKIDPYFPLFREGDYWLEFSIAGTSKTNPGEYVIKAFETPGARRKFMEELKGNKDVVQDSINELERPEKLSVDRIPPTSFIGQTFRILSANNVPSDVQKEMMRLVIELMPESSFVKSLQARKGTLGFEEDLLHTFRNKAPQLVQQTVRLEYGAKIRAVEQVIRDQETRGKPNLRLMKEELLARGDFARNPPRDAIAESANRLAFLYTIGGNVSSALTQISSMATIIYPYFGGKYGYTEAGKAIKSATSVFLNSGFNRRIDMTAPNGKTVSVDAKAAPALDNFYEIDAKGNFKIRADLKLSPELRKEVEELLPLVESLTENGQLHRSLLADTIGLKDAYKDKTPWERVNAIAAFLFHQSDQFNRQITAVAAYKLELARLAKAEPDLSLAERRKKAAQSSLYETQLTNGGTVLETAPRIAQQGIGRVAMMYKSYGITINYLLLRTARAAVNNLFAGNKKDRDIAFKQLVGVFGSTAFLAGVQGLPLFGVYTMIANLFYDDDEDDAETRTRKAIGEGFYKGAIAEFGGIDISERIGLSNLIFQANRFNKDPSFEEQVAYVFGGPALSVAARFGRGVNDIAEGNVVRGVEGMVPTSIANVIKGTFRYPSEGGIMTRRGDPIYDDISAGELLAQTFGFAPSEYTFRQEQNAARKGIDIATNKLRSKLHKRYYLATRMGDYSELQDVLEEIVEYNRKHPTYPITPESIKRSAAQHMKTSAEMHNGISISRGMRMELQQHLNEYDEE
jgi:hypothetical protein